jgi:hypothetical protein
MFFLGIDTTMRDEKKEGNWGLKSKTSQLSEIGIAMTKDSSLEMEQFDRKSGMSLPRRISVHKNESDWAQMGFNEKSNNKNWDPCIIKITREQT